MPRSTRPNDWSALNQRVAVNAFGWSIADPLASTRQANTVINCYKPSRRRSSENIILAQRRSLEFTDRELDVDAGPGTAKFLVVGYAYPSTTQAQSFTRSPGLEWAHARGYTDPNNRVSIGTVAEPGLLLKLPRERLPWIVVHQIAAVHHTAFRPFVLCHPTAGLCRPIAMRKILTFYFHEFRDKATSWRQRDKNWSDAVRQQAIVSKCVRTPTPSQRVSRSVEDNSTEDDDVEMHSNHPDGAVHSDKDETMSSHEGGDENETAMEVVEDEFTMEISTDNDGAKTMESDQGDQVAELTIEIVQDAIHSNDTMIDAQSTTSQQTQAAHKDEVVDNDSGQMNEEAQEAWRAAWWNARVNITLPAP